MLCRDAPWGKRENYPPHNTPFQPILTHMGQAKTAKKPHNFGELGRRCLQSANTSAAPSQHDASVWHKGVRTSSADLRSKPTAPAQLGSSAFRRARSARRRPGSLNIRLPLPGGSQPQTLPNHFGAGDRRDPAPHAPLSRHLRPTPTPALKWTTADPILRAIGLLRARGAPIQRYNQHVRPSPDPIKCR